MSLNRKSTGGHPDCAECEAAGLRMKEQGFRNWRTAYACYDHAALSLEGPAWEAMLADQAPEQPDLFTDHAA